MDRDPDRERHDRAGRSPTSQQTIRSERRCAWAGLTENHEELLTSVTSDGIAVASAGAEVPAEIGQHFAPGEMPEPVVELLEVIEVQQQQRITVRQVVQQRVDV